MKYQGSKARIVNDILPIMLENYNGRCFVDAFCGSCTVIQDVPSDYIRIANDRNSYLVFDIVYYTTVKCECGIVFQSNEC